MIEEARLQRNAVALAQCHATMAARVRAILAALEARGFRPRIQCAWRSPQDQALAHAHGNSRLAFGFHNTTTADGQADALAVDVLDDDSPITPGMTFLAALAIEAARVGCQTGILWGLPPTLASRLRELLEAEDLATAAQFSKRGWDPCHVEPRLISVAQARRGVRPGPWPPTAAKG